jgi:hypothetical protein
MPKSKTKSKKKPSLWNQSVRRAFRDIGGEKFTKLTKRNQLHNVAREHYAKAVKNEVNRLKSKSKLSNEDCHRILYLWCHNAPATTRKTGLTKLTKLASSGTRSDAKVSVGSHKNTWSLALSKASKKLNNPTRDALNREARKIHKGIILALHKRGKVSNKFSHHKSLLKLALKSKGSTTRNLMKSFIKSVASAVIKKAASKRKTKRKTKRKSKAKTKRRK